MPVFNYAYINVVFPNKQISSRSIMLRLYFISVLYFVVIIKLCCSNIIPAEQSTKRAEKYRQYHADVFGTETPSCSSEFPFVALIGHTMVSDGNDNNSWGCYGSLISSQYVLTTAHCLNNTRLTAKKVRLGATNYLRKSEVASTDYDIEQLIRHPDYRPPSVYNDIGLIKLSRKVNFSRDILPIRLPDNDVDPSNDVYFKVHHLTESEIDSTIPLTKYGLQYITNEKCSEILTSRKLREGIIDSLMCTRQHVIEGQNCRATSGAPVYVVDSQLACTHVQAGILSFGAGCGEIFPEISTKVYNYIDWIENTIWSTADDY